MQLNISVQCFEIVVLNLPCEQKKWIVTSSKSKCLQIKAVNETAQNPPENPAVA
jgi:hypothetical protein